MLGLHTIAISIRHCKDLLQDLMCVMLVNNGNIYIFFIANNNISATCYIVNAIWDYLLKEILKSNLRILFCIWMCLLCSYKYKLYYWQVCLENRRKVCIWCTPYLAKIIIFSTKKLWVVKKSIHKNFWKVRFENRRKIMHYLQRTGNSPPCIHITNYGRYIKILSIMWATLKKLDERFNSFLIEILKCL